MYDLQTGRLLRLTEIAEVAKEAEAAGFESLWVMDHYWLANSVANTGGHHPFITLAYLAAQTESATLGTLVACGSFRSVGELARQALAVADAAPGRFILGLGAGWQRDEFDAFDHDFDRRVGHLQEVLEVLPRLLRGERCTYRGHFVRLSNAYVASGDAPPPQLWLAAFRPRMLALAARFSEGWNTAWHGPNLDRFQREIGAWRGALEKAGRDPAKAAVSVGLWMLPVSGQDLAAAVQRADDLKPPTADFTWPSPVSECMITGPPEQLADIIAAYAAAGADHIILNLSVAPFSLFDSSYVGRTAKVLQLLRDPRAQSA
jgi:alkanesulfonate monooxygenase SsuD/methylene tetrahydromethanopterin reductase-like flavin-dependent oxidoreductase (luciferase family)